MKPARDIETSSCTVENLTAKGLTELPASRRHTDDGHFGGIRKRFADIRDNRNVSSEPKDIGHGHTGIRATDNGNHIIRTITDKTNGGLGSKRGEVITGKEQCLPALEFERSPVEKHFFDLSN